MLVDTCLPHISQSGLPIRSRNQGISGIMVILGIALMGEILISSTALGSHLESFSVSPLPPQDRKTERSHSSFLAPRGENPTLSSLLTTEEEPSTPDKEPKTDRPEFPKINNNTNSQSHVQLGWEFLLNGRPQAAVAAYRQALRQNPQSANAFLGLGITLKSLGHVKTAKKALVQAVNIDPRLPSALVHLGYLYVDGHFGKSDPQTARRLFSQASKLGDPFAHIALLDIQARKIF